MGGKVAVAIVKGQFPLNASDIEAMVKSSVDLIGGLSKRIRKGDHVVIKPNLFAPYPPPISVDRRVIASVVRLARRAGATRVTVIEGVSVGTLMKRVNPARSTRGMARGFSTIEVMRMIGVKRAVEDAGGEVIGVEDAEKVVVDIKGGKALHRVNYPKVVLDADYFINIPAMKTHTMTMVTLSIKNLQGLLDEKGRYFSHRDDLDQHMVDINKIRKPDLVILDGLIGMEGMGAGEGGNPVEMGVIMAGDNPVAVDAIASMCMGIDNPMVVGTTRIANHDGLGVANPFLIEVVGNTVSEVRKKFELPINFTQPIESIVTGVYPNIDLYIGGACPTCWLMTAIVEATLAKVPQRFSLIVGVDPKIPPKLSTDIEHTFFLGECALSTGGDLREIRNEMQLGGIDRFLGGCPPYEQALVKIEEILIQMGYLDEEALIKKAEEHKKRFFDYYRSHDSTWEPEC
ncbi:MAG: DUF362 domain-containing protein [Thermodesulfobacteriota bacterium]|nr:DUF362 domain-containing protein [Thermodesulfobacteriota bacterium]